MKTVLLFLFILTSVVVGKAQDTLYMKDGKVLEVRIYEVNKNKIEYKLFSNLKGPLLKIKSNKVERIAYENGQNQVLTNEEFKRISSFERRNRINLDLLGLGAGFIPNLISYERLNEDGDIGIEIPFTVFTVENNEVIGVTIGVTMKNYIGGSGRGFYYGPTFSVGGSNRFLDFAYLGMKAGWQLHVSNVVAFNLGANVGTVTNFYNFAFGASVYAGINFSF
jgi:hypothetical protein